MAEKQTGGPHIYGRQAVWYTGKTEKELTDRGVGPEQLERIKAKLDKAGMRLLAEDERTAQIAAASEPTGEGEPVAAETAAPSRRRRASGEAADTGSAQ